MGRIGPGGVLSRNAVHHSGQDIPQRGNVSCLFQNTVFGGWSGYFDFCCGQRIPKTQYCHLRGSAAIGLPRYRVTLPDRMPFKIITTVKITGQNKGLNARLIRLFPSLLTNNIDHQTAFSITPKRHPGPLDVNRAPSAKSRRRSRSHRPYRTPSPVLSFDPP